MSDQQADSTARRILEAALHLFSQQGYSRTPTRQIAAEAGVNEVTLFRHYGSKKNLLAACIDQFNAAGFAATFTDQLTGDYHQDILQMARAQVANSVLGFPAVRLLLCDAGEIPELRAIAQQGAAGNLQQIARYFEAQIAQGVVRAGLDPLVLAQAFDSLFSSAVLMQSLIAEDADAAQPDAQTLQQLVDLFVQGTQKG